LDPGIVGFFARAEGSLSGELISEPTLYEFASQRATATLAGFSAVGTRDCRFANVLRETIFTFSPCSTVRGVLGEPIQNCLAVSRLKKNHIEESVIGCSMERERKSWSREATIQELHERKLTSKFFAIDLEFKHFRLSIGTPSADHS